MNEQISICQERGGGKLPSSRERTRRQLPEELAQMLHRCKLTSYRLNRASELEG